MQVAPPRNNNGTPLASTRGGGQPLSKYTCTDQLKDSPKGPPRDALEHAQVSPITVLLCAHPMHSSLNGAQEAPSLADTLATVGQRYHWLGRAKLGVGGWLYMAKC